MIQGKFRNVLIAAGAYYINYWIAPPLAWGCGKLTQGLHYTGNFETAVLMPLVLNFPYALVAAGVGGSVAWLVDSKRPLAWSAIPAALYLYFDYMGHEWAVPPTLVYRISQIVGAAFLALACLAGAVIVVRRRRASGVAHP